MKTCFKCGEAKPLADFYRHPEMADGHLNKCKTCTKSDVARRYAEARPQRAAYERARARHPERRQKALTYRRQHRRSHPERLAARQAVFYAVKSGRLTRQPCRVCGSTQRVQAHHADYARPLDVEWLCFKHHREHGHAQVVSAT